MTNNQVATAISLNNWLSNQGYVKETLDDEEGYYFRSYTAATAIRRRALNLGYRAEIVERGGKWNKYYLIREAGKEK